MGSAFVLNNLWNNLLCHYVAMTYMFTESVLMCLKRNIVKDRLSQTKNSILCDTMDLEYCSVENATTMNVRDREVWTKEKGPTSL